jgi:hypothetical protein
MSEESVVIFVGVTMNDGLLKFSTHAAHRADRVPRAAVRTVQDRIAADVTRTFDTRERMDLHARVNIYRALSRVGGELEESIIHGYSNKYHDGFLGHAYVGEWVNLGAQTTNSDLRNDYSNVSVSLDGRHSIDTGSPKAGSLIGDHAKTSIGTMLNTGAYVGAMTLIAATGKLLPRFIPSFGWFVDGCLSSGFGKTRLYSAAKTAMLRRGRKWTDAQHAMWEKIYELTAGPREHAIKKGRRTK